MPRRQLQLCLSLALLAAIGAAQQFVLDDSDGALDVSKENAVPGTLESCLRSSYGKTFHHDDGRNKGSASFTFSFDVSKTGCYKIEEYHPGGCWNCRKYLPKSARLDIDYCKGYSTTRYINQACAGGRWNEVGRWMFYVDYQGALTMSNAVGEQCDASTCYWTVDAFRLTWVGDDCSSSSAPAGGISTPATPASTSEPEAMTATIAAMEVGGITTRTPQSQHSSAAAVATTAAFTASAASGIATSAPQSQQSSAAAVATTAAVTFMEVGSITTSAPLSQQSSAAVAVTTEVAVPTSELMMTTAAAQSPAVTMLEHEGVLTLKVAPLTGLELEFNLPDDGAAIAAGLQLQFDLQQIEFLSMEATGRRLSSGLSVATFEARFVGRSFNDKISESGDLVMSLQTSLDNSGASVNVLSASVLWTALYPVSITLPPRVEDTDAEANMWAVVAACAVFGLLCLVAGALVRLRCRRRLQFRECAEAKAAMASEAPAAAAADVEGAAADGKKVFEWEVDTMSTGTPETPDSERPSVVDSTAAFIEDANKEGCTPSTLPEETQQAGLPCA